MALLPPPKELMPTEISERQRGQVAHEHGADMLQTQRDGLLQGHLGVELICRLLELDFLQMFHSPQTLTKYDDFRKLYKKRIHYNKMADSCKLSMTFL